MTVRKIRDIVVLSEPEKIEQKRDVLQCDANEL